MPALNPKSMAAAPPTPRARPKTTSTYGQILKSSAIVGASSALTMLVGMVRTKAMALLLGPAGFGLMGAFLAIVDLVRSVVECGVNSSGVRQIADAVGSGDEARVARTALTVVRVMIVLGLVGAAVVVAFSRELSLITFGTDKHAVAVALLSVAVFFRLLSDAQAALIQGTRRIGDLARSNIVGAALGATASVAIIYHTRDDGIAFSIGAAAFALALASWWYARKVRVPRLPVGFSEMRTEARELLRLGLAFMISSLFMAGSAYAVKLMLLRQIGMEAAGLHQAAWTLGGLYVGFVLQAMSADFYPRLVAVAGDNAQCNSLVNEQAQVSMLLAGAGVMGTLALTPIVLAVFYSAQFGAAAPVMQWICLGMTLRVVTWPMGFIIVAKNAQRIFIATELAWAVVNVGLSWICIERFGLVGAGIGFFGSYVFHWVMIQWVVRRMSGFSWSRANRVATPLMLLAIAAVFAAMQWLPTPAAVAVGLGIAALTGLVCMARVASLLESDGRLPQVVVRAVRWLGFRPRQPHGDA